jgi:hypothetical protein
MKTKLSRCVDCLANIYDLKSVYTRLEFPDNHGTRVYYNKRRWSISVFSVTLSCSVDLRSMCITPRPETTRSVRVCYSANGNDAMLGTDNEKFPERCIECRQRNSRFFGKRRVSPYTHRTRRNVATTFLQASVLRGPRQTEHRRS